MIVWFCCIALLKLDVVKNCIKRAAFFLFVSSPDYYVVVTSDPRYRTGLILSAGPATPPPPHKQHHHHHLHPSLHTHNTLLTFLVVFLQKHKLLRTIMGNVQVRKTSSDVNYPLKAKGRAILVEWGRRAFQVLGTLLRMFFKMEMSRSNVLYVGQNNVGFSGYFSRGRYWGRLRHFPSNDAPFHQARIVNFWRRI